MSFDCAICIGKVNLTDASVLNCGHCFHRECLDSWLDKKPSCPECRSYVDRNGYARFLYTKNNESTVDCDEKCLDLKKRLSSLEKEMEKLDEKYVELNDEMKFQVWNINNFFAYNDIDCRMEKFKELATDFTHQMFTVSDLVRSSASLIDEKNNFAGYFLQNFKYV